MSSIAFVLLLIMIAATGTFYAAGQLYGHGSSWAIDICYQASFFCERPQWVGVATGLVWLWYIMLRRSEA
jgi:hypothetical protein